MRADRLLSILMILQAHGRTKAHDLADKLEVSERTIYRDIEALSSAGVPVYAERGPGGGCALVEGYRTTLTGLTGDEVRTLFLSGATHAMADLGLGSALDAAKLKLLATLPSIQRQQAERVRQRIHLDTANWNATGEEIPHLRILQDAVWNDRKLRLTYHSREGTITERIVDPLGLVAKTSTWYLVAGDTYGKRVFRVSRIQAATLLDDPCERPDDFDLVAFWGEWRDRFKASLVRYLVLLRITPEAVPVLPQFFGEGLRQRVANAGPPDADGCWRLEYIFESFEAARSEVLRLGTLVEVIEPPELREGIAAMGGAHAPNYDGGAKTDTVAPSRPLLPRRCVLLTGNLRSSISSPHVADTGKRYGVSTTWGRCRLAGEIDVVAMGRGARRGGIASPPPGSISGCNAAGHARHPCRAI